MPTRELERDLALVVSRNDDPPQLRRASLERCVEQCAAAAAARIGAADVAPRGTAALGSTGQLLRREAQPGLWMPVRG